MSSCEILLINLKKNFKLNSLRKLSKQLNISSSIILNWSSGRSSPSLEQLNLIAYRLNIEISQLIKENTIFSLNTPVWKDGAKMIFLQNIGRYRIEKEVCASSFENGVEEIVGISYRTFLKYMNGKGSKINLSMIDKISQILSIESYKLLESEK